MSKAQAFSVNLNIKEEDIKEEEEETQSVKYLRKAQASGSRQPVARGVAEHGVVLDALEEGVVEFVRSALHNVVDGGHTVERLCRGEGLVKLLYDLAEAWCGRRWR